MTTDPITVNVVVDEKIFRAFALFDSLRLKKIWRAPVLFAAILSAFAAMCFALRGHREQADLIGCVLLVVGLGLPAVYAGNFFKSITRQTRAMGLERPRPVYSVRLSREPDGVQIAIGDETIQYQWNDLFGAYRVVGCVYLYAEANRAFLLPSGQADAGDDTLWSLLTELLPGKKTRDCRRGPVV